MSPLSTLVGQVTTGMADLIGKNVLHPLCRVRAAAVPPVQASHLADYAAQCSANCQIDSTPVRSLLSQGPISTPSPFPEMTTIHPGITLSIVREVIFSIPTSASFSA